MVDIDISFELTTKLIFLVFDVVSGTIRLFVGLLMDRLKHLPSSLQNSLEGRCLLKVISGLSNFDPISVEMISSAAGSGGADLIDVACDPDLVRIAIEASDLPICVSAVEPELFPEVVDAGASIIEIGNFDSFYPKGRFFSAKDVLDLTKQSRKILPEVVLSVTVPHVLPLDQQAQLAVDLVDAGADLIQTEGGTSSRPFSPGSLGLIEKAAPTLAATSSIVGNFLREGIKTPVICASGLSAITIPMALAVGASGVGVGSLVNRLGDQLEMLAAVRRLREAIWSDQTFIAKSLKD